MRRKEYGPETRKILKTQKPISNLGPNEAARTKHLLSSNNIQSSRANLHQLWHHGG
jgi:hypothetical protein